ncbi:MAG: hypothetical protein G01um101417_262 [Parcubacteria group bacterium Gr01-1014_17]|nr:MAG: hypothetical protein G01um101417_262 [Parcubacteria group bacterium Gr01-1014_17]
MENVTIISNLKNKDSRSEDIALAKLLDKYFRTEVLDLFDDSIFSKNSFFLIRNVWGCFNGSERMLKIYHNFSRRNIYHNNRFIGMGDQKGKRYLVKLYNTKYQVVPSFNNYEKALRQDSKEYLLKPIYSGSGKGIVSVPTNHLKQYFDAKKYIIQPKIKFASEISFFFIDNNFHHALKTKGGRWDLELYFPTAEESSLAYQFVEWNPMTGIQRIDFLKTYTNKILLLEIEDWCPYLSLLDVKDFPVSNFVSVVVKSIQDSFNKN